MYSSLEELLNTSLILQVIKLVRIKKRYYDIDNPPKMTTVMKSEIINFALTIDEDI